MHNSLTNDVYPNQLCGAQAIKRQRHTKYEGKFPDLSLLFYVKKYGLPCVAEKGKPPYVLITANEPYQQTPIKPTFVEPNVERALTLSSNKYVERALHFLATNMWKGPYTC
jgi:hypothetical protein